MPLKVLVIDRAPPLDSRQGNALIGYQLFRRLRRRYGHQLTLVCPAQESEEAASLQALVESFSQIELVPRTRRTPALSGLAEGQLVDRVPFMPGFDLGAARRLRAAAWRAYARDHPDVVHVRQLPMAAYADHMDRSGRLLELIDSETLGTERAQPATAFKRMRARVAAVAEGHVLRRFDVTTTVADADAARLRQLEPLSRVVVVPNGVDAEAFRLEPGTTRHRARIVFVGAMSYPPNVAAVRYFADRVLPQIHAVDKSVAFQIVGRDPASGVRSLAGRHGVEVTGEVEDVRPFLSAASIFVAPMISGSGIKNKVLEAFAMQCAVVATSLGVEGLPVQSGQHMLVADDPEQFATAVLRLIENTDERDRLGSAARRLVEQRFSWDQCAARYNDLYRELALLTRKRAS